MYVTQDIADRIKWRLKEKGIRTKDMLSDLNMGINAISEFAKGKQMSCIAPVSYTHLTLPTNSRV